MPEPLVKRGKKTKPRSRNKNGTWRKKRNDVNILRKLSKNRDEILAYYETLPGKLSLRLNDPDLGLSYSDEKDFVKPVEVLMDEIKALQRQVDILMKDNAELRIKLKAYEREAEIKNA